MAADLGITPFFEDAAGYIDQWCELLGDKPTAIFSAATAASKAAAYLQAQAQPPAVAV